MTKQGVSAIFHTAGNDGCHVTLRGDSQTGPNYDAARVDDVSRTLVQRTGRAALMIDCSHGNSLQDFRRETDVAAAVADQVAQGSWRVFGAMLESHLKEGRQY